MTAGRPRKEPKWQMRLDGEVHEWVQELMEKHPGTWASERAALHELVRIGRLTFAGPAAQPAAEASLDVQSGVGDKDAPAASSFHIGNRVADSGDVARAEAPPPPAWKEPPAAPSSFGWRAPTVRCERCGKDVETTAEAREAHFKECPPDPEPELDLDALAADLRARLREGPPVVSGRTPRDVQLEILKDLARARGFDLGDADAAGILERALGPGGQVQTLGVEHGKNGGGQDEGEG